MSIQYRPAPPLGVLSGQGRAGSGLGRIVHGSTVTFGDVLCE